MESVDRNKLCSERNKACYVALRMESVDRNPELAVEIIEKWSSLSAWRAWIEIVPVAPCLSVNMVALRMESVDRNIPFFVLVIFCRVALRMESVDRNFLIADHAERDISRSPHGERG